MLHENSIDPQAELQSALSVNSTAPAQTPAEQLKTQCAAIRSQQWGAPVGNANLQGAH